ncbi:DNA-processing protein DprA [Tenacibaculum agarivorans]|uniref:DNA-processing protein DprA n=1 Tax=Tenacibaculum agarivorans TaxID=1908389 RepID=UPI000B1A9CE5|nr:DNA-processing protein DprA [Tenacibaculum agarivorans]
MLEKELLAVLRLQATPKIGDITAKKLIRHFGTASQIFKEKKSTLQKLDGVGDLIIKELLNPLYLKHAEKELEYIFKNNVQYSYFLDVNYPKKLQHCIDAPILIFYDGKLDWNTEKIISIVGTRNMTNYGRDFCTQFISEIAEHDPLIISGFAYGVDICAHKAAIENNLQTIGVFANGLDQLYPKRHKKHVADVLNNGGLISEFWHNEKPMRENFLKRNRIVAGMSKATIIVESAEKGGALVTADIANSYHRDVFALPGKVTDYYSKGCNNLIKNNQAHLLTSAHDVIKMLNWDIEEKKTVKQTALFIDLDEKEQKIYDYLLANGQQLLDVIAIDCDLPVYQLSSILIQMELKGVVKPKPGKMFEV